MIRAHPNWLLIPAAMLIIATLPMPYGYYTLLRLVVTAFSGAIAYLIFRNDGVNWQVIILALIALLFNPVFVVGLTRAIWLPINLTCAAVLAYVTWHLHTKPADLNRKLK